MLRKHGSSAFHRSVVPTEHAHKNDVINVKAYVMKKSLQGPCSESCLDRCSSVVKRVTTDLPDNTSPLPGEERITG